MEIFANEDSIPRSKLVEDIFKDNFSELDRYEVSQILSYYFCLGLNVDNVLVKPWSMRIQVAFRQLVSDPMMQKQKERVQNRLKKFKLKSKKKDLMEEMEQLRMKINYETDVVKIFLENARELEKILPKKGQDWTYESIHRIKQVQQELQHLESELKEIEISLESL